MKRLVITGASGQLGRRTAEIVLERCRPEQLILVTRNPKALAGFTARGVDVRRGDFADPAQLRVAFAGGERLLLVSTTDLTRRIEQHGAAIEAAAAAGVEHVIYTSALSPHGQTRASSRRAITSLSTRSQPVASHGHYCATVCMPTIRWRRPRSRSKPARSSTIGARAE